MKTTTVSVFVSSNDKLTSVANAIYNANQFALGFENVIEHYQILARANWTALHYNTLLAERIDPQFIQDYHLQVVAIGEALAYGWINYNESLYLEGLNGSNRHLALHLGMNYIFKVRAFTQYRKFVMRNASQETLKQVREEIRDMLGPIHVAMYGKDPRPTNLLYLGQRIN